MNPAKMKFKVLCTSRSFGAVHKEPVDLLKDNACELITNPAGKPFTESELVSAIKGIDAVIVGIDKITRKVIAASDRLKVISKHGTGLDTIDVAAATEKGVVVTSTPGVNADAVADLAFALMLCVARRITESVDMTREGAWNRVIGVSVWDKTIGIIGLGRIGKGVALRAKGFNMRILGCDIIEDMEFNRKHGIRFCAMHELLAKADFVVIACSLTSDTAGLIGGRELSLMKRDAYLINTSRAGIVDQKALFKALKEKTIAGAGLDVYEKEPPAGDPLIQLDNVVPTSHIGAYTTEAIRKMGDVAAQNVVDVLLTGKCRFSANNG